MSKRPPEADARPASSDTFVEAFARGLDLLRAFGRDAPSLTISEAAARAGMTRAGARRLLHTLLALGYARQEGGSFRLTPKVLELGQAYLSSLSLREAAQPVLDRLADTLDEVAALSILEGDEIVFVARAERRSPLARGIGLGGRLPAFATSMGRVLLAGLDPAQARERLESKPLEAWTRFTRRSVPALLRELGEIRTRGYAVVSEELELGVCGIAVPVHDATGRVVAAVNVSTNLARHSRTGIAKAFLPALRSAAAEIADGLRAAR